MSDEAGEFEGRLLLPLHEQRRRHEAEDQTAWIWDQLIAPGYLTRIDGRPKIAGKSSLLFALCTAIRNGEPFLGFETRQATIAYCSEQRWRTLNAKLIEPFGSPPYLHLYHDEPLSLGELVPRLLDETEELGVECVILDTFSKWLRLSAGGRFDPDVMAEQMGHLETLSQRLAVVVCDYTRKGESARGEGTLGATEQTGRADILIEVKAPDPEQPRVRRLEVSGRSDAPEEIDFLLSPDGRFQPCDLDDLQALASVEAIVSLIEREGGMSGTKIAAALGRRKQGVVADLGALRADGRVEKVGAGPGTVWRLTGTGRNGSEPDAGTDAGTDRSDAPLF